MKYGKVYLVGAGPGDPGLITVKGNQLLREADLVVYDHLVDSHLLSVCPPNAKIIYAGKQANKHTKSQKEINTLLVKAARSNKTVIRLKGGDPFLFGRGGEEALELRKAGIDYEVVPGVTSAIAVAAYAGIPITHRGYSSSVAIVTGHEDPDKKSSSIKWKQLATACDTLVFLMGVGSLPGIVKQLIRHGRKGSTACAVIEWGTTTRQRVATGNLENIVSAVKKSEIKPPAVIVVGEVVSLRSSLEWFEKKPLFGKRILVTRASDKAAALSNHLQTLGAEVEELPAIELAPVASNGVFKQVVKEIPQTDWVFFTSPEGIGHFIRMLKPYKKDIRLLSGCRIGAIGPKTAMAIEQLGLHVDFIPKQFSQEGLLDDLPKHVLEGKKAFILSATETRDVLEKGLKKRGMHVKKVAVYRTLIPKALIKGVSTLFDRPFDWVTVTSASCVEHLYQGLEAAGKSRLFSEFKFASIGPITSAAVLQRGGYVVIEATPSTIEGLVDSIEWLSSGANAISAERSAGTSGVPAETKKIKRAKRLR